MATAEGSIRVAVEEDAGPIDALRVATWKAAYRGLIPDAGLDTMRPATGEAFEPRRARLRDPAPGAGCLVCETDGTLEGFVNFGPTRDEGVTDTGEIYALYVLPDFWGTGRGRRLTEAALEQLDAHGFAAVTLWLLEGNEQALRFYRAAGFEADGTRKTVERLGAELVHLRLRRVSAG